MARLPRISPAGVPVHLIQRGNNRHTCFGALEDYSAYVGWLKENNHGVSQLEIAVIMGSASLK